MAGRRLTLWACLAVTVGLGSLAQAQGGDGESVLKAREAALAARDADAVMELFADDAVVGTSSGRVLVGKEQVRVWIADQVDRQQREEPGTRQAQGKKLAWSGKVYRDDWQKLGISPLEVRQDAVIQDGKIKFFNTTFSPESWTKLEAARKRK
jgi:hypothetical protein